MIIVTQKHVNVYIEAPFLFCPRELIDGILWSAVCFNCCTSKSFWNSLPLFSKWFESCQLFLFVCTLLEFSGKLSTVSYCTALKNSIQLAFHWKLTKKWLSGQFWQRLEQSSSLHQLKVAIEERPYFRSTAFFLSIMFDCSNSLLPVFFNNFKKKTRTNLLLSSNVTMTHHTVFVLVWRDNCRVKCVCRWHQIAWMIYSSGFGAQIEKILPRGKRQ